jgi:adenosylcobinamide amidohydrolase
MKKYQENLTTGVRLEHTARHIHVRFDRPTQVVSSAVLNGGAVQANHILNLNVADQYREERHIQQPPDRTLAQYCRNRCWAGTTVGLMTAASMDSFRMARATEQGVEIFVLVTAGLSNARRAGDWAEYRKIGNPQCQAGTINIICLTTAVLTQAAMIEAVITATEAKAAALQNLGIKSPASGTPATGTGTDAVAVACGHGSTIVQYCGKHVIFGEILAKLVIEALTSALYDKGDFLKRTSPYPDYSK